MKKIAFFAALFVVFATTSCNKCQTCTCAGVEEEVCEGDEEDGQTYEESIDVLEALGCDCQ